MNTMPKIELDGLTTESRNQDTLQIDRLTTLEMMRLINREDQKVPLAIEKVLPEIASAVDVIAARLEKGGRLFYLGAGTSGRLGVLDAAECPPTYGTAPETVQGVIAGGPPAIFNAQEGAEDSPALAQSDLREKHLSAGDVVVGIAASGRTPYVIGGLEFAGQIGAATIAVTANSGSPIAKRAAISIAAVVGPEVITGSTRMKSGTAQKLILNMLSTGAMIKLGKVYGNLMVDVKATNLKLRERACRIVMEATGTSRAEAEKALEETENEVKPAIFMLLSGLHSADAKTHLEKHRGYIREALQALSKEAKA